MTKLPVYNEKDKFDFARGITQISQFIDGYQISSLRVFLALFHLRIVGFAQGSKENRIGWPAAENVINLLGAGFPLGRLVINERRWSPDTGLISPLWEDAFVQVHHDRILRFQLAIEKAAHVTTSSDRTLDGD